MNSYLVFGKPSLAGGGHSFPAEPLMKRLDAFIGELAVMFSFSACSADSDSLGVTIETIWASGVTTRSKSASSLSQSQREKSWT
jgi:hypothetical protein